MEQDGDGAGDHGGDALPVRWLLRTLDWLYDRALDGIPGIDDGVEGFAQSYRAKATSDDDAINALISWQLAKAGAAGFATNLGGLLTLPAAIPANLTTVLYVQIRMIATIAYLRGYDLRQDQVKTFVFACLIGTSLTEVMKEFGIKFGTRLTKQMILRISGGVLRRVNQAVGFRLITKTGTTGLVNLVKIVPFVGGVVAGGFDVATTKSIAETAKKVFVREEPVLV